MVETPAPPEGDAAAVDAATAGAPRTGARYRSPVDEAAERLRHRGRRLRGRLDRSRRVVLRDFLIYELKLFLDGLKGAVMGLLTIPAIVLDLLHPGDRPGHRFYGVMRLGERLDRWLSLYGVAEAAEQDPDGMFGVSRAGSPTLLGRLEALVDSAVVGRDADHLGDEKADGGSAAADAETPEPADADADADPGRSEPSGAGHAPPPKAARVAGDLFDQGLEVLDRAVDVLDKPGPADPGDQPV